MPSRLKRLAPFAMRQWRILTLILAVTAVNSVVAALQPWPMKLLVDYALQHESLPASLSSFIKSLALSPTPGVLLLLAGLSSIAVFALFSLFDVVLNWLWALGGQRMVYDLATTLFLRLQRRSMLYHCKFSVGDSLSRLSEDSWCVYTLTGQCFSPVEKLLTLITIGIIAWRMNPDLAFLSLIGAPLLAASTLYFGTRLKSRKRQGREAETHLMSFIHQTLAAMPVVQAFTTEERNSLRFQRLAENAATISQRSSLISSAYGLINGLITTFGSALVLFVGGREVLAGKLSLGSLLVFMAYMRTMQRAAEELLKTYGNLKPVEASIDRIMEIFEPDPAEAVDLPGARCLNGKAVRGHVCLQQVTYGYQEGRPVLHNISLEVQPGEMIGLVGTTGAGKTTLVSLIPRFFDPWAGRVVLDGLDVREIQVASLREQIGIVLQEPFLLARSVAENIGYGRLDATRSQIIEAAIMANADDFIRRLPDGYDTVLGESGATVSGGERQRLAIARALLKNAPVLILDEPTSALDAATEAMLLEALERLMEGRTTFVIAHRLSTIRRANRIVVLEHGQIVQQGTHDELVKADGLYRRLHALQSQSAAPMGAR